MLRRILSGILSTFSVCLLTASTFAAQDVFEGKAWTFLCENMPAQDCGNVSEAYLRENLDLALAVREKHPWSRGVPEDIFLNAVLPYSSIGEEADAWRPLFHKQFMPLVADCKNATQVAEKLNSEIWKILGIIYSPKREKPDQSPFHSMRLGMASCSGLSIILVNACRAVGVPARFAGCRWKNKPGNHSWVEFWDRGQWHYIGAFDSPKADESWFDGDIAAADEKNPVYAIYAANWAPTGTYFNTSWRDSEDLRSPVPAHNVTSRYLQKTAKKVPQSVLSVCILDASGKRVAVSLRLKEKATQRVLAEGISHDDTQDLNNHFTFAAPAGTCVEIYARSNDALPEILLGEHVLGAESQTLHLTLPTQSARKQ